ncbi:VanW family protein [Acetohalobium arabaticum]|uniref:VanW family protein n=1 Tax=Acetohalobium arabaticum (strain ATCC 49924 / DSM 5501 / Z-7288) TaxID=574087 RepID=D9QTD2_ACEAZ|nr:VanW family protein [Acetohalobium arabaticum]ADL11696.1 VanW family protein [Acetohalobium arabaticum DSM 5501]
MKNSLLAALVALTLLFSIGLGIYIGSYFFFKQHEDVIFSGVMIEGYDFSGLTKKQAKERLKKLTEPLLQEPLVLERDNDKWLLRPDDIELKFKNRGALNKAFGIGRSGTLLQRSIAVWQSAEYGKSLTVDISYNEDKLDEKLQQIANEVNISSSNAYLDLETEELISFQLGKRLRLEESKQKIISRFNNFKKIPVKLVIEKKVPEVNREKLKEWNLTNQLSSYKTSFDTEKENRVHNIKLAAQKINATLLKSGEVFSFNQTVGRRSLKNGFKQATEIVNQEFVTGVGGGVCQVSSTLYNAVLLGDLKVLERHNHSRPVGYIPLGRGAAIYNGYLDFKFKNTSSDPIMILAKVLENSLEIAIMGQSKDYQIEISTSQPKVLDYGQVKKKAKVEERKVVKEGKQGYQVKVVKKIIVDNELINKEIISQDVYQPVDKVIKVPVK